MRFDVLTLFPEMFSGPFSEGVVGRAIARGDVELRLHDFRKHAKDRHGTVDDAPFGGGAGMVLKPEPLFEAVEALRNEAGDEGIGPVVLLSPQGRVLTQQVVEELASQSRMVLICGRYEGVDERVREHLATDDISIGDYVLSGGELAAMVLIDAVARFVPGVVGSSDSTENDTFSGGLLQHPQYTRPAEFRGWAAPDVLLSGNHKEVSKWRRRESLRRTFLKRPDLLAQAGLSQEDRKYLSSLGWDGKKRTAD
ncbi:MAG: tRNA (guanosine(37)-N1)-methyltransferase TrmD [SAR202 cluster bacterium]|nr:tRNA (guanosine(37)-N1)-methyltransferase TrmD [SAR202 cluster bacterium]